MSNNYTSLQDLAIFVEVARCASITKAGKNLGLSISTISRRINALEKECGAKLFNRSTRRIEITATGSRFLEHCGSIVDEAKQAGESLRVQMGQVDGTLRISMPPDFGAVIIAPFLSEFARRHSGINFQLDLSPQFHDVMLDNFDVVLRMGAINDESLVSRQIGWLEQNLYASADYLKLHGAPQHPSELARHDCIFIGKGNANTVWSFTSGDSTINVTVRGRFSANNQSLMRFLAERGMGVALLESSLSRQAEADGTLQRILTQWSPPRISVHAVTSSRLQRATTRTFIDFIKESMQNR